MNIHAPSKLIKEQWPAFDFIGRRHYSNGLTFIKVKVKRWDTCINGRSYVYCFEKNAIGTSKNGFDIL